VIYSMWKEGYMANDLKTNMHAIIEDNDFLKLKINLLKHDQFTCKLAQIKSPIIMQNFAIPKLKLVKGKKNTLLVFFKRFCW
jgi:hypothetical protein